METAQIIIACITGIISLFFFIFSYRQYKEKGKPINNSYIFASKKQREEMNFSPIYKQSAVTFFLCGLMFLLSTIDTIFIFSWILPVNILLIALTIIYCIVSAIYIGKKYGIY